MLNQVTHLLLDAARLGDRINEAKELNTAHDSLYRGGPEQKLTSVAPYLFPYQQNAPFAHWYMEHGWGNSWGVMFSSSYGLPDLYKHFRKFVKVNTEDGGQMYFRFYDPRVLRVFLQTCDAAQLREFFGPVSHFIVEDEQPGTMLKFTQNNGVLKVDRALVANVYTAPPKAVPTEEPLDNPIQTNEVKDIPEQPIVEAEKPQPTKKAKNSKWNMFD